MEQLKSGGVNEMITGKKTLLKLGIIGTGNHSRSNLLPCLPYLPVKTDSACAAHIENAQFYGSKYGAHHFFTEYQDMLSQRDLDLVICSISKTEHPNVIQNALEKNISVFTEKPAAKNSETLKKLMELDSNKKTVVGFQKRFVPNYQMLKASILDKKYGDLNYLHLEFGVGAFSGGLEEFLLEIGIHFIDLLRFFVPNLKIVNVKKIDKNNGKINVQTIFENDKGLMGSMLLSSNFDWSNCHERVFANFDKMNIEIKNLVDMNMTDNSKTLLSIPLEKVTKRRINKSTWTPNYISGTMDNSSLYQSGFLPELEYFTHTALGKNKNSFSNLENAYKTHLLLEEILNV